MDDRMTYADKPWLKSYKLGPYKLEGSLTPYPNVPVFKALDDAAEKYPGQTAVLFLGRTVKYRDLKMHADRLAAALFKLGVRKGDKVCLFLPNCMEFIISDWAVLKTGAAVVPTSVLRTDEGLIHEIKTSGSRVIVCREEYLDRVLGIRERCDIDQIVVAPKQGFDLGDISTPVPEKVHTFRELLLKHDPIPPRVDINPTEDLCELAFTGGATGVPKGVMITHYNRYCCIRQGLPWIMKPMLNGILGKASVFLPIPLFHAYGHYVEQAAAYCGLRLILMPDPRDTEMLVQYIREYRPLLIAAVPTQFMRMAQAKVGKMNVILMSGSAPLPREVAEAVRKEIGTPVSEAYGLTETSPLTHFNLSGFSKITGFMPKDKGGLGIPAPDTECKLADPETGEDVPFGEPGEIVVRGPQIMKGYWPEPGSGLTEDGWLHTGDIALMDEDGYFHLVDRAKDMVNVSGMKVYTTTLDEILYKHPGVHMAVTFGIPDPNAPGSERVMAVIQLKDEYKGKVTEEEIREFCRSHVASYAVPKLVEFRDEMPLTVTEKLFKKALKDEVLKKLREKSG